MIKNLLFEKSNILAKEIYRKTFEFPSKFQFSVAEQLRRSSLSIVLNVVEGGARKSLKEKRQFLNIAFGSLKETKYLIYFSKEFNLVGTTFYNEIMDKINELAKIIYVLLYKKNS